MPSVWIKIQGKGRPFQLEFPHGNINKLKKIIKSECSPVLDAFAAFELHVFPPAKFGITEGLRENLDVLELLQSFGSSFENPWIVRVPMRGEAKPFLGSLLPCFSVDLMQPIRIVASIVSDVIKGAVDTLSRVARINPFALVYVIRNIKALLETTPFSATFSILIFHLLFYFYLVPNKNLQLPHFSISRDNLKRGRLWTLITCSFAHADISHLLANMSGLASLMSVVEASFGPKFALMFYTTSSIASSLVSALVLSANSIGSSGTVFAFQGLVSRLSPRRSDWKIQVLDMLFYAFAVPHSNINHVAHIAGFVFGYNLPDTFLMKLLVQQW